MTEKFDIDAAERELQRKKDAYTAIAEEANINNKGVLEGEARERWESYMADASTLIDQIDRAKQMQALDGRTVKPAPNDLGLTRTERRRYSLSKHLAWKAGMIPANEAKLEVEIDEAIAKRSTLGSYKGSDAVAHIPFHVMAGEQRDLTVATEGADIVEETHGGVIELLRKRMVTQAAGVRVLTGLRGDLILPKHTAATTNTAWVTEGNAPSEGTPTFGQVKFEPSQLTCYMDVTRQTLLQSSFDVEAFLREDLATNLAIELDRTVLHGSGSGAEPAGVFNTSSIGDVAAGTSGGAPTWAHIVELETDVAVANADMGSLAYITNAAVRGKLKTTERVSSTGLFVWQDPANLAPATPGTPLNGYRAFVTNQVRSDLTKGTYSSASAIFFGNWEEGIVGIWDDFSILVDPYTGGSAGIVRLVGMLFADFQVRHPESFSVMKDAIP